MPSGSAAFKAAAVAAVLMLLVLPSFVRCSSLGPAPPPPAPVPAPPVSCSDDCRASLVPACQSKCSASMATACRSFCDRSACDECRSKANSCTACCNDGTCNCDCKTRTDYNCTGACSGQQDTRCRDCQTREMNQCMSVCLSDCDATCQPA